MDQLLSTNRAVRSPRPHHRLKPGTLLILLCLFAAILLSGCENYEKTSPKQPTLTKNPSDNDIVEAVRRSVKGKTYQVKTQKQRTITRTCSQLDVDMDPYMPRNPELAKCPRVGKTYQKIEYYTVTETRTCSALPQPGSQYGWRVVDAGKDQWRVTNAGKVWDVKLLGGAAANLEGLVKVSSFTFQIKPRQDC